MKKLSLLLSVVLFSSAALFAGDDKKEKKAEVCKKESSCCANKKTAKEGAKTSEMKVAENNTANRSQALSTPHKVKELPANQISTVPARAEASAK
ncbi:MAG: hypothetical protein EOP54_09485 [Sphingobacteriales bacterium]|nr:MAG: hypothetical protein EOP54_09485 [Sphingobacteriales bacterium]